MNNNNNYSHAERERETIKSLQTYDNWKQSKKKRETYLKIIASLIGMTLGILLTWLILKVSPKDTYTLTKGVFAKEDKLEEYLPKLDEVDDKLKNSIVAKPLNWLSKKHEEQIAQELLKGNFKAIEKGVRDYCLILIGVWLAVVIIIWTILYYLAKWIIGSFIWKEPNLYEKYEETPKHFREEQLIEPEKEPCDKNYSTPRYSPEEKPKSNTWLWIILGVVALSGIGLTVYFVYRSNSSEEKHPDYKDLPSHAKAEEEINKIKSLKGLDDQQATIEFLSRYIPKINWWEIDSLHDLDDKIKLVNKKCKFPPLKEVPNNQQALDDFNAEWRSNFLYRNLAFLASVCPRKSDNSIDWKGKKSISDYMEYLKPELENNKFKPAFATEDSYRELSTLFMHAVNSNLAEFCSEFAELSNVKELNELINKYLGQIFRANVCAGIHDDLGKQVNISNHSEYELKPSGNNSVNRSWGIYLTGYKLAKKTN
jgi:hypothetical protein